MAEEVYRIIPAIRKVVQRELFVQKNTNKSTSEWLTEYVQKGQVVRMIFTSNEKPPCVVVSSSWSYSPYERKSNEPAKKYVMLRENGEWIKYHPLTAPVSRWGTVISSR
tara:strand:+ start:403 stop:729 length:327 start_codon:yes stop_codon:yes gene_type:complete